jgi:predicted nucleic acid-binding Zn ribbon protein
MPDQVGPDEQPAEVTPDEAGHDEAGHDEAGHDEQGLDLARLITRSLSQAEGRAPRRRGRPGRRESPADRRRGGLSGAGADDRDPQLVGPTLDKLVSDRGWEVDLKVQAVFGRWAELVGADVAARTTPEAFADGKLVVRTDSTAWAVQLRLLAPTVVRRLNEELGHGTVTLIEVLGPHGPSWKKGRLTSRDGRGPRDTYG